MLDSTNRILLVDDDAAILRGYAKALTARGWSIETASDGRDAIQRLRAQTFDVVVSDVAMPNMGGLDFMRAVREHDLDVPVILMTGQPDLESAIRAVAFGAFHYLVKPVEPTELDEVIRRAARLHTIARLKREALEVVGATGRQLGDRAALEARFTMALKLMWMAYQPIVSWKEHEVFGYEALLRSGEPTLRTPGEILLAAERLERLGDLGHAIRSRVAKDAAAIPDGAKLFVNLHASDFNDEALFAPDSELASIADRVVFETTEHGSLDRVKNIEWYVKRLKKMGFRLAIDDVGAGYAGLSSFAQLEPEIAKFDGSLVRGIDTHPKKQAIVRSMTALCHDLGTRVVAEAVETTGERNVLTELGCDLLQGHLFGRPERGFPAPLW